MATTQREAHTVADATATIGTDPYHLDIQAGQHRLTADDPGAVLREGRGVQHGSAASG